jgi:hypothetical protein
MASKASISRISKATKEKIRDLYVKHGVPKHALAQRFHMDAGDVTRITKGIEERRSVSRSSSARLAA